MNCQCSNIIRTTGFGTTADNLVILTSGDHILENGRMFNLIVCKRKPSMTTVLPVVVQVNGVNYPLLDRIGNPVMSDQIQCRTQYRIFYGQTNPHFLTTNCLRQSQNYLGGTADAQ